MNQQPVINPNLEWYLKESSSKNLSPRCPFANVQNCPRFYQSLSLIGQARYATKIFKKKDKKLLKRWRRSSLWPITREQESSILSFQNKPNHFNNFCPEVSFEQFKLFASYLSGYSDENDTFLAHSKLSKIQAPLEDWRWTWESIQPQHYSECSLYSTLPLLKVGHQEKREDIIDVKPNWFGIGLNLNALIKRTKEWLKLNNP